MANIRMMRTPNSSFQSMRDIVLSAGAVPQSLAVSAVGCS
jgi:hypothetical protein